MLNRRSVRAGLEPVRARALGPRRPAPGSRALALLVLAVAATTAACGSDGDTRMLPPDQVAMNPGVMPVFKTDELTIYEVKKGLQFPILAPSNGMPPASDGYEPYGREPWITLKRGYRDSLAIVEDRTREVHVALEDGQLRGFLILNMSGAFAGYIQTICVAPEARSRRIGTSKMAHGSAREFFH